ncbi:MAG TPA: hypothetical protein VFE17_03140 [Candidatus Baltobacteraceae bacterium]|nr:hypothetical protein [Candidatus Baltobacteraceae bacterium]
MRTSGRSLNSLLLGLPVALLAHIVVFGGEHAAGAAWHNAVLTGAGLALLAVVGLRARRLLTAHVSPAPARHALLDGFLPAIAGAGWFSTIELCEQQHAVPIFATAAAVALIAVVVRAVVHAFAHVIAGIAVALLASIFVRREATNGGITLRTGARRIPCALAHALRLFSRPPPAFC